MDYAGTHLVAIRRSPDGITITFLSRPSTDSNSVYMTPAEWADLTSLAVAYHAYDSASASGTTGPPAP